MTPLIQNEIDTSLILKTLVNYSQMFVPIVSHQSYVRPLPGNPTPTHLVLLTREIRPWYSFAHYVTHFRYYLDLIDTYKGLLVALNQLQQVGLVYGGFAIFQDEAIRIDAKTKRPLLHQFCYSFQWQENGPPVEQEDPLPEKPTQGKYTQLEARNALALPLPPYLVHGHPHETNRDMAHAWDVHELSQLYLHVCDQIASDQHPYFPRFVNLLQRIVTGEGEGEPTCSANDVLRQLDHLLDQIIE